MHYHSAPGRGMVRGMVLCLAGLIGLAGCAQDETGDALPADAHEVVLGPVDGHELAAADLERVKAGDEAPDFTAMSFAGEPITLSQFRGRKNVVLFFYRGHW